MICSTVEICSATDAICASTSAGLGERRRRRRVPIQERHWLVLAPWHVPQERCCGRTSTVEDQHISRCVLAVQAGSDQVPPCRKAARLPFRGSSVRPGQMRVAWKSYVCATEPSGQRNFRPTRASDNGQSGCLFETKNKYCLSWEAPKSAREMVEIAICDQSFSWPHMTIVVIAGTNV